MLFGFYLTSCNMASTKEVGHELIHHNKLEPTCTQNGYEAYDTCSKCNYTTYEELPPKGHTPSEWIVDIYPTCVTEGKRYIKCIVCEEVLYTETIEALGHDLVHHDEAEPTPISSGKAYDTCSRCDYSTREDLSKEEELYIKETYCNYMHSKSKYTTITPDDVKMKYYLGKYGNAYVAVMESDRLTIAAYAEYYDVNVDGNIYLFKFLPQFMSVYVDGMYYYIKNAYELGLLTSEDIKEIKCIFMKFFESE